MHRRNARTRTLCLLAILLASGSAHCQPESRRLPYIPPKLHNWPQPYRGVPGLEAHVFVTGFVELPEALLIRGGAWTRMRQLPVTSLVLQHPQQGVLVVDSGLSKAVAAEKSGRARSCSPPRAWCNSKQRRTSPKLCRAPAFARRQFDGSCKRTCARFAPETCARFRAQPSSPPLPSATTHRASKLATIPRFGRAWNNGVRWILQPHNHLEPSNEQSTCSAMAACSSSMGVARLLGR